MSIYPPDVDVQKTPTARTEKGGIGASTMGEEAKDQSVIGQTTAFPPSQHQHKQLRQQHQQYQQMEYQEKQILQHKLNQQQPHTLPQMSGNMQKYMPPPPTTTPTTITSYNNSYQPQRPLHATNLSTSTNGSKITTNMLMPKSKNVTLSNGGDNESNVIPSNKNPSTLQQVSDGMQNLNLHQIPQNGVLIQPYTTNIAQPTSAVQSSKYNPENQILQPPNMALQQQKQYSTKNFNNLPLPSNPTKTPITAPPDIGSQNHYVNKNSNNLAENGPPQTTETTARSIAPNTQRRQMYPMQVPPSLQPQPQQQSSQLLAPNKPLQNQYQQLPYADVYQQSFANQQTMQQQKQPFPFNGKTTTGTLQYQSQQQMPNTAASATSYIQSHQQLQSGSLLQQGFSRIWGQDTIDLMQIRHIMATVSSEPPKIILHNQFHESINCNPK